MNNNSRFTVAIHILTWMALAERQGASVVTSEQISISVNTNPVVIRRILSLLGKARLVSVQRGTGAGWSLVRQPQAITLRDVFEAVTEEPLFEMHAKQPNQRCPVGKNIQTVLGSYYDATSSAMKQQLSEFTIAEVLDDIVTSSGEKI